MHHLHSWDYSNEVISLLLDRLDPVNAGICSAFPELSHPNVLCCAAFVGRLSRAWSKVPFRGVTFFASSFRPSKSTMTKLESVAVRYKLTVQLWTHFPVPYFLTSSPYFCSLLQRTYFRFHFVTIIELFSLWLVDYSSLFSTCFELLQLSLQCCNTLPSLCVRVPPLWEAIGLPIQPFHSHLPLPSSLSFGADIFSITTAPFLKIKCLPTLYSSMYGPIILGATGP